MIKILKVTKNQEKPGNFDENVNNTALSVGL